MLSFKLEPCGCRFVKDNFLLCGTRLLHTYRTHITRQVPNRTHVTHQHITHRVQHAVSHVHRRYNTPHLSPTDLHDWVGSTLRSDDDGEDVVCPGCTDQLCSSASRWISPVQRVHANVWAGTRSSCVPHYFLLDSLSASLPQHTAVIMHFHLCIDAYVK